jgi:hypothetical protein
LFSAFHDPVCLLPLPSGSVCQMHFPYSFVAFVSPIRVGGCDRHQPLLPMPAAPAAPAIHSDHGQHQVNNYTLLINLIIADCLGNSPDPMTRCLQVQAPSLHALLGPSVSDHQQKARSYRMHHGLKNASGSCSSVSVFTPAFEWAMRMSESDAAVSRRCPVQKPGADAAREYQLPVRNASTVCRCRIQVLGLDSGRGRGKAPSRCQEVIFLISDPICRCLREVAFLRER